MAEPITLYRGDRKVVTYAPSIANQMQRDGWSTVRPENFVEPEEGAALQAGPQDEATGTQPAKGNDLPLQLDGSGTVKEEPLSLVEVEEEDGDAQPAATPTPAPAKTAEWSPPISAKRPNRPSSGR